MGLFVATAFMWFCRLSRCRHNGGMARLARVVVPGCPHHITQRGNRRHTASLGLVHFSANGRILWSIVGRKHGPVPFRGAEGRSFFPIRRMKKSRSCFVVTNELAARSAGSDSSASPRESSAASYAPKSPAVPEPMKISIVSLEYPALNRCKSGHCQVGRLILPAAAVVKSGSFLPFLRILEMGP